MRCGDERLMISWMHTKKFTSNFFFIFIKMKKSIIIISIIVIFIVVLAIILGCVFGIKNKSDPSGSGTETPSGSSSSNPIIVTPGGNDIIYVRYIDRQNSEKKTLTLKVDLNKTTTYQLAGVFEDPRKPRSLNHTVSGHFEFLFNGKEIPRDGNPNNTLSNFGITNGSTLDVLLTGGRDGGNVLGECDGSQCSCVYEGLSDSPPPKCYKTDTEFPQSKSECQKYCNSKSWPFRYWRGNYVKKPEGPLTLCRFSFNYNFDSKTSTPFPFYLKMITTIKPYLQTYMTLTTKEEQASCFYIQFEQVTTDFDGKPFPPDVKPVPVTHIYYLSEQNDWFLLNAFYSAVITGKGKWEYRNGPLFTGFTALVDSYTSNYNSATQYDSVDFITSRLKILNPTTYNDILPTQIKANQKQNIVLANMKLDSFFTETTTEHTEDHSYWNFLEIYVYGFWPFSYNHDTPENRQTVLITNPPATVVPGFNEWKPDCVNKKLNAAFTGALTEITPGKNNWGKTKDNERYLSNSSYFHQWSNYTNYVRDFDYKWDGDIYKKGISMVDYLQGMPIKQYSGYAFNFNGTWDEYAPVTFYNASSYARGDNVNKYGDIYFLSVQSDEKNDSTIWLACSTFINETLQGSGYKNALYFRQGRTSVESDLGNFAFTVDDDNYLYMARTPFVLYNPDNYMDRSVIDTTKDFQYCARVLLFDYDNNCQIINPKTEIGMVTSTGNPDCCIKADMLLEPHPFVISYEKISTYKFVASK